MLMSVKLALTHVMRMLNVLILRGASIVLVGVLTLVMDSLVYVRLIILIIFIYFGDGFTQCLRETNNLLLT